MSDSDGQRPVTNTEAAIDDVIASAAGVVDRTLDRDGVPPRRVTAKDVPPMIHRLGTAPDLPTERVPVATLTRLAQASAERSTSTPSLSPFEVPARHLAPPSEEHDTPTRRVTVVDEELAARRVTYPVWILGGTAFVASIAGVAAIVMRAQMASDPAAGGPPPEAVCEVPDAASAIAARSAGLDAGAGPPRSRKRRVVGQPDR